MLTSDALLHLLRRAHAGEDPDMVLLEVYANAPHVRADELVDDDDDA